MASSTVPARGLQLRSLVKADTSEVELTLLPADIAAPSGPDDIVVRVEAAPVNPSDLGILVGAGDLSAARASADGTTLTIPVPAGPAIGSMLYRAGTALPVGYEGAGTVVAAGSGAAAQALLGKRVAAVSPGFYSEYRSFKAGEVLELPAGTTAAEGASAFVNPLTVLGFVETMKREGHTAIVHTAAASNLGQMLVKVCLGDKIPLVNVVRSEAQVALLRGLGATHVVNSSAPDFMPSLIEAIAETGATLAFDPIAGGKMAANILAAMEVAINRKNPAAVPYNPYGSPTLKQVYIYGVLNPAGPLEYDFHGGISFNIGGWLVFNFLARAGAETVARLKARVAAELKTTFASAYTGEISLQQLLDPTALAACNKKTTGSKYLVVINK